MRREAVTSVSQKSGQDIGPGVYARGKAARRLRLVLPALLAAMPVVIARSQQAGRAGRAGGRGDEERVEGVGPARARFAGPSLPAAALLEDGEAAGYARERCEPVLVARDGGGAWLLCVEYEVGVGDRIAVREVGPDGRLRDAAAAPVLASASPGAIVRPVAALDPAGRLRVVWTALVGGRAQLWTARGDERGFDEPFALTTGAGPDRNAEIVRHGDGTLWVAWERWRAGEGGARGSIDVVLAPLLEKSLGEAVVIGGGGSSDLDPVLASAGGRIAVGWCGYVERDYEILARSFDPATGELGAVRNVSSDSASDDVHPSIAATPDGALWFAWDRFEDPARGSSAPPEIRAELGQERRASPLCSVRVARLGPEGSGGPGGPGGPGGSGADVRLPKSRGLDGKPAADGLLAGAPLHSFSGGTPRLVSAGGRVHVLFRFLAREGPGGKAYGFPLLASVIDEEGVAPPVMLAGSAGAPEEPAACASGGGVLAAWQQDHRLECETATLLRPIPNVHHRKLASQGVIVTGSLAPSGIGVARLDPAGKGAAAASAPRPARLAPPHFHPSGDRLDDPIVSGADHLRVAALDREYKVFWGDLHRHSSVSRCSRGFEPGAADRWTFGRDVSLYDFMALTDHTCHVDALGWWRLDKIGELSASPGFVALAGFEWSTGLHGHQNVILRGGLRPFLSNMFPQTSTPGGLYAALSPETAVAIPHHPADVTRRTDFSQCSPALVRLVEIYQAQRGSYEFDGCYRQSHHAHAVGSFATDALKLGLKVGFIASTDHGEGASYACVLAESLERGQLFDALRARRTYGATAKGMLIDLRVDGRLMGEEVAARAAPGAGVTVSLRARGATELAEVVVFRNGEPWQVVGRAPPDPTGRTELTLQLELAPPKQPRASDWTVTVAASDAGGVTMKPWFELPVYARDDLGPDRPEWTVAGGVATYSWKKSYAGFWEPIHSRLRLRGPRDATLRVVAAGPDGAPAFARELRLADLAASADIAGDSPLGPWRLGARESFDAHVDPSRTLGVRELTQEWTDAALPAGTSWYYARILQQDGELAWSSPIWVTRS